MTSSAVSGSRPHSPYPRYTPRFSRLSEDESASLFALMASRPGITWLGAQRWHFRLMGIDRTPEGLKLHYTQWNQAQKDIEDYYE